jgi:hypothetical protein
LAILSVGGCRSKEVTVEYDARDPHAFTPAEQRAIEEVAEKTIPEVRKLLPDVPRPIVLMVHSSKAVIPETGENGSSAQPNGIVWDVDPSRPEGVVGIARTQLRATLFHELHHLVRAQTLVDDTLVQHCVREGLATAFERSFAGVAPPWGAYGPEVSTWATEILAQPGDTPRAPWLFEHPDGRRWIGMRVGTYWADRAAKAMGKTSAELVHVPAETVVQAATH